MKTECGFSESIGVTSADGILYIISQGRLKRRVAPLHVNGNRWSGGTRHLSRFTACPTLLRLRLCVSLLPRPFLKGLEVRRHRDNERRDPHLLKRYGGSG